MAIDFPSAPTLGQLYTYGGRSWQWNGYAWDLYSAVSNVVSALNGFTGTVSILGGTAINVAAASNNITISYTGSGAVGNSNFYEGNTVAGFTTGDRWYNTDIGKLFTAISDNGNVIWVEFSGSAGPQGPVGMSGSGYTGAEIRSNYLYITKIYSDGSTAEMNLGYIGPTGSSFIFDTDLVAAFGTGKSFGKYLNGETVPAQGKTAVQVIQDALFAILAPTVGLTSSTVIQFNQTAIGNTLNFNYVINTLNAGPTSGIIEYKRTNGTTWATVFTGTGTLGSTCYYGSYGHTLTDSNYNTNGFNYRYTVSDTYGGTATAGITLTPVSYAIPTATITQTGITLTGPETNTKREKGNVKTNISASITKNSPLVPLTGWEFSYSENGGGYASTGFTGIIAGNPSSASTGVTTHTPTNTINSVTYRLSFTDSYQDYLGSNVKTVATTINLVNLIFHGPTATAPTNSNEIRGLPTTNRRFVDAGNVFTLNTGTAYKNFVVALPSKTIVSVIDSTALNANITSQYVLSSGLTYINDYAGNTTSYNVYIMSPAGTYSANHEHIITTS